MTRLNFSILVLCSVIIGSCNYEPQNLALNKNIQASNSTSDAGPQYAVDDNRNTMWNSGMNGAQSIELDLGGDFNIKRFELLCTTTPPSEPELEIFIKTKDNPNYISIIKRTEKIKDWDSLVYYIEKDNVTHVKLTETNNQSWVALLEFRVFGN